MMTARTHNRGVALLLVLWAMIILSLAVVGVIRLVRTSLEETTAREKEFEARLLAESGVALASHPMILANDPLLVRGGDPQSSLRVTLRSEGARLHINVLLGRDDGRPVLIALFVRWGLGVEEAHAVADSLADWVDADDLSRLNGAERRWYVDHGSGVIPRDAAFQSVDEMALVRGMDVVGRKKNDWRDAFTIWGDGTLDLNEAPADLVQAATGVTREQAETLVRRRDGLDSTGPGVKEGRFESVDEARAALGVSPEFFKGVADRLAVESAVWRIESVARVMGREHRVEAVVRKKSAPVRYLTWTES